MEDGETSNPYCKLQLGKEKNKTKNIPHTVNPKWREGFNLYWYEEYDDYLAITILDRDIGSKSKEGFMGR